MNMGDMPSLKKAFENKHKIICAGNLDKWTHGGHTKLKPGGKIDLPLTINGTTLSLVFHIKSIETKKAGEMDARDFEGNVQSDKTYMIFDPSDAKGFDSDMMIIELDTVNEPVRLTAPYKPTPTYLM